MKKHYNTFDLAMMKQRDRMSYAEISEKTGIEVEEVRTRVKEYGRQVRSYATESHKRFEAKRGKAHHNSDKHPERNSQYAEKGR